MIPQICEKFYCKVSCLNLKVQKKLGLGGSEKASGRKKKIFGRMMEEAEKEVSFKLKYDLG